MMATGPISLSVSREGSAMTDSLGVRRTVLFSSAACLLLASGHATAQAPPAASDADQRLKALETKMDRVLRLLEPRTPAPATPELLARYGDLIAKTKDELQVKYETAQKEYADFRIKSPFPWKINGDAAAAAQRLAKDEGVLSDLQQRQAEVAVRAALVKNVGDAEKEARALLLLVQRRGVDIDMLRRTAGTRRDEEITPVVLVRLYGASLKQEAEELQQLIQVTEGRIDQDRKIVREMGFYQIQEERLRAIKDQSAKFYDVLLSQLARMEVEQNTKPKR
jgi:hypothetical protein